jgi:GrpB-like predicted nucleotidyltransferase (UPF0157 family)
MNSNIETAKEYEKLKMELIKNNRNNIPNYHKDKEQLKKEKIEEANKWKKEIIKKGKTCTGR